MGDDRDLALPGSLPGGMPAVRVPAGPIFRKSALAWGGEMPLAADVPATLPQALRRAAESGSAGQIMYVRHDGAELSQSYRGLLTEAERMLAGLRANGLQAGDKAILLLERGEDILAAFWGCVLGGIVPVLSPVPPTYAEPSRLLDQLIHVWGVLERPAVVTDEAARPAVAALADSLDSKARRVAGVDGLRDHRPDGNYHPCHADDPAFFSLTSGSTKLPKCVVLTHRNVLQRAAGANQLGRHSPDDVALSWLPFDHVGSLSDWHLRCVLLACRAVYAPKEYVLSQPLRWLDLIEKYGVTHTWAPNFAYKLLDDLLTRTAHRPWDLSRVKGMVTAGEAVSPSVTQRFAELLASCRLSATALRPAFGMAEMASGVTYYLGEEHAPIRVRRAKRLSLGGRLEPGAPNDPDSVGFVSLGPPIPGVRLRIVDASGNLVPEDTVGQLQVQGGPVSPGYYRSPEGSPVHRKDGWFETGDRGFLSDGELYLVGRVKESVIVNGVHYGCAEIEELVDEVAGVLPSFSAACPVRAGGSGHEQFAVFFCAAHAADGQLPALLKQIRGHLARHVGIQPDYLVPLPKESIPKTALGKLQRGRLSQQFEAGEFDPVVRRLDLVQKNETTRPESFDNDVERRLIEIWKEVLNVPQIGLRDNLFELGGNSVLLVQLHSRIEAVFGPCLSVVDMFRYPTIEALSRLLGPREASVAVSSPALRGRQRAEARKRRQTADQAPDVAVVGLACRFPGAANAAQFWRNLAAGVESISVLSEEQVLASGVDPSLARNPRYVRAAAVLSGTEQFDADFFGYTAREAELLDPQQRVLLECAWEAMEDAGYDLRSYPGAVGVFVSGVLNTYLLNHLYPNGAHLGADAGGVMTLTSTGGFQVMIANDKDYLPTRISYKLNLHGPSVNVQTACSSSLVAVHMAAQSLLLGECEMALAGGVSIAVPQETGYLYQEGLLVSPDGHCRAFDANAQGTVFGNGAGLVLLKRLADAVADGDRIYAVIKGSAVNNDGGGKAGYLAPSQDGQAAVVAEAMAAAGVSAASISYVEAHGTGTALGDPVEIAGLSQAFRADTERRQFCAVGSVKTNVGHLQIASGVAGFIKTVLALHHRQLVPSLHFRAPNPRIDFANSPFYVNTRLVDWPQADGRRRATVNSLGIGGTNAHVVLEESPDQPRPARVSDRPTHILALSARSRQALKELAGRWAAAFAPAAPTSLGDACFTANAGRAHFRERLAVVADGWPKLHEALERFVAGDSLPGAAAVGSAGDVRPRVAFVFGGARSYDAGMGRELYDASPSFRHWLQECDSILRPSLDGSLVKELYADPSQRERLPQALWREPAVFAVEHALARLWMSWGVEPSAVIGCGVGLFAAACIAGVFSLEDALRLVAHRARLKAAGTLRVPFAEAAADTADGTRSVPAAFNEFRQAASQVAFASPRVPVLSPLGGPPAPEEITSAEYWCRHFRDPDHIPPAVAAAVGCGCDVLLETVPGPTRLPSIRQLPEEAGGAPDCLRLPSLARDRSAWDTMLTSLAALYARGAAVDWSGFDRDYPRRRTSLPTYPFQRSRYWIERPSDSAWSRARGGQGGKKTHALLGRRVTSPALEDVVFESQIGIESLPILDDHRLCDTPVLPGAFQLIMACEAGSHLGVPASCAVEDISFAKAVLGPAGSQRTVQIVVSRSEGRRRAFRLFSRPSDEAGGDSWTVHSAGRIVPLPADAERLPPEVRERYARLMTQPERMVSREDFYAAMREHHVQLGPSFQAIEQAWAGQDEFVCRIRMPEVMEHADPSLSHAVLVDACVQVLGGIEPYPAGRIRLPTAVARFCFLQRPAAAFWWCYVRLAPRASDSPDVLTADAWLFEPDGRLIATLGGLRLDEVPREVLLKAFGKNEGDVDWIYRPIWVPRTRPAASDCRSKVVGPWLVFADQGGVGDRLATLLQERDGRCVVVRPGKRFECNNEGQCRLDPGCPQDFLRLMEATWGMSAGGYRGAVYLWGLDQPADPRGLVDSRCSCAGALYLIQALGRVGLTSGLKLCLVTRRAQAIGHPTRPLSVWQAPLWGLGRTAALEYPEIECLRVDLDLDSGVEEAGSLLEELCLGGHESEIALRGGVRHVARLERQAFQPAAALPVRSDATYLVTGGSGGLGLHMAACLAQQGARHLVLLSRRGASSQEARRAVEQWIEQGITVHVAAADVAHEASLAEVFARIRTEMPPLAGVVHAAGIRNDGMLQNLSWDAFQQVMEAKAIGAWNLHRLTEGISLDFFLGCSSIASLLGSPGQGNYAAANAFLDGLMHERHARNLPGLAVNWGPWKEVGMAAALGAGDRRALARRGLVPLEASEATRALPSLVCSGDAQLAAARIDWRRYLEETGGAAAPMVEVLIRRGDEPADGHGTIRLRLEQAPGRDRFLMLLQHVRELIGGLLGVGPAAPIELDRGFTDLGLDSLAILMLRNQLQTDLGLALPATLAFKFSSVQSLVDYLAETLGLGSSPAPAQPSLADNDSEKATALDPLSLPELAGRLAETLAAIRRTHGDT